MSQIYMWNNEVNTREMELDNTVIAKRSGNGTYLSMFSMCYASSVFIWIFFLHVSMTMENNPNNSICLSRFFFFKYIKCSFGSCCLCKTIIADTGESIWSPWCGELIRASKEYRAEYCSSGWRMQSGEGTGGCVIKFI